MSIHLLAAAIAAALACAPSAQAQTASTATASTAPSADDPATTTAAELDRVQVFGSIPRPMPANTSQLQGDALRARRQGSDDSSRLLEGIPGLNLQHAGGVSALPAIHGLGGDRNRILVDGMEFIASCPNHMNPPMSYIAPSEVARITVHTAVTPVSSGGDSIGGSIQVQSQPPRFAEDGAGWQPDAELGMQLRSNGNARAANAALSLANADWHLGYEGSVSRADNHRAGGDFRDFTASGREGHELARDEVASSAYLVRNHRLNAAFRHGRQLFQASVGAQDIPRQLYPNQRMDMLGNDQRRWQLAWEGGFDFGAIEARLWQERLRHSMGFGPDRQYWYGADSMVPGISDFTRPCGPIGPTCAGDMPMETESRTTALTSAMSIDLAPEQLLRLGAEWLHYRLDDWWPPSGGGMAPGEFWNIRDGRRQRASVYAEWEGRLAPRWQALAGIRHTRVRTDAGEVQGYDIDPAPPGSWMMTAADAAAFNARERRRSDNHLDASALLRFAASDTMDLEFGIARKTRSPNLYERYAWSRWAMAAVMNNFAGDGNGYVGDIDLKPETATTLAATLDWRGTGASAARLRLTPWLSRISDYIDAVPASEHQPGRFNVLRHANQAARLYGVDASASATLAETARGSFGVEAIANWQRGENRDSGQPLYNTMPPNLRLSLQHRQGPWQGTLEWLAVSAKTRVSPVRNEVATAGYGLVNLRGSWQRGQWRVDAGIDNLFDRLHALPTGGLYLAQGRTMGINAIPHGIAVPGPGRSFNLALSWSMQPASAH